ncbi:MAG TPA: class I SAM-dependent methyltransferase [Candidatus Sumerlaeota bacterium]|nr:class I SAM-dependent methyltransferase [Candidatus Sumerlaeota bacterium]
MKTLAGFGLEDVQKVYSGPEGRLWELVMGEQIHIGGLASSTDLAERAEIGPGMKGVDLCCCTGAGMRFLVRFRGLDSMIGVDATLNMVETGRARCEEEGLSDKIRFIHSDACGTGLPSDSADFVWGEDAWCYVEDKSALIAEAVRVVRPGGIIAFTDWVEGASGLSMEESARFLRFMKFPNIYNLDDYRKHLAASGCEVLISEDTGRFAPHCELYIHMLSMQLTYDALKIISFDGELMKTLAGELDFTFKLAQKSKIIQAIHVARKI